LKPELTSVLLIRLDFPESQWGEMISIYANLLEGMIYYEAVDFYGNEINLSPIKKPRTFVYPRSDFYDRNNGSGLGKRSWEYGADTAGNSRSGKQVLP
jgi:hypothetical protein